MPVRAAPILNEDRGAFLEREAKCHDELAADLDAASLPRRVAGVEAPMHAAAGDLRGRDVLKPGYRQGNLTLLPLERGGQGTALYISAGRVAVPGRHLSRASPLEPRPASWWPTPRAEDPGRIIRLVVGKWTVRHLDAGTVARKKRRVPISPTPVAPGDRRAQAHRRVRGAPRSGTAHRHLQSSSSAWRG
jgi:hypothetical protein